MRNAWRVFSRDVRRLGRVRKAWIILIGLMITPSLYAWLNIAAFWDPYGKTQSIDVAVVNLDDGASTEATGDINVGDQVVDALRDNDQLGWHFVDQDSAMESVRAGSDYAAIVIPADFSRNFASITSGNFTRPNLQYYVNEKANAVAPKITDVGASTLDNQINSTFVSVVAETVTDALKDAGRDARGELRNAQGNTLDALGEAVNTVGSARERIIDLNRTLAEAQDRLDEAKGNLDKVDGTLGDVQTAVDLAQDLLTETQQEVVTVTDSMTGAYTSGVTLLAETSSKLNESIVTSASGIRQANVGVGSAIDTVEAVLAARSQALTEMRSLRDRPGLGSGSGSGGAQQLDGAVTTLQERLTADQRVLDELRRLNTDITGATSAIETSADDVDAAVNGAATSAGSLRGVVLQTVPDLNHAMSTLSASAGGLSSALGAQRTQLAQAQTLLAGLGDQLGTASTALDALDGNFSGAQSGLEDVRSDVLALGTADVWNHLRTVTGLNTEQIGQFLASPVEVHEHPVFPVATYGSAMAPLFTNLALWIGGFVLVVLLKLEVDTEGVSGLTARQAYFGRWMLLAAISVIQALIVTVGTLAIGVQTVSAAAFIGTGVLIGLAYLSIIYALSVCFGFVGKGLVVLLVIMQIPGASGLYPIEVMPGFFRALHTVLPFTYGINAMRETIAGFYDGYYWHSMGVLALYVALAFALGLILRPRLGNLILLFNRKIAGTQLFVSEDVQIASGRHRLSQLIDALVNRDEYRSTVEHQQERFTRRYPSLLRLTGLVGIAGLAVIGLLAGLAPIGKASVLGLWVLWGLLVIVFLVALEYTKRSLQLATAVGRMPEAELRRTLAAQRAGGGPPSPTPDSHDYPLPAEQEPDEIDRIEPVDDPVSPEPADDDETEPPAEASDEPASELPTEIPRDHTADADSAADADDHDQRGESE